MTEAPPIGIDDLHALIDSEAPEFVEALVAYCEQPEPVRSDGPSGEHMDLAGLRAALTRAAAVRGPGAKRRRQEDAHELWKQYLAQPDPAPRMAAADLLVGLYRTRSGPRRRILLDTIERAPLIFGIWGGLKRIYKEAEADFDAPVIGAFAARVDGELARPSAGTEVSAATLRYVSRRIWRFLRQLGKASPELYPSFAVEVLRASPEGAGGQSVGARIERHAAPKWGGVPPGERPEKTFLAPFQDAWKRSADPLLLLLETCRSDAAARFAIRGLRELFPAVLRAPRPEWMARLCFRPLGSAHELVVETLEASPDYPAARLRERGLHDAVIALLRSPSPRARQYAIAYARGQELPTELLIGLLDPKSHALDVVHAAAEWLTTRPARSLGVRVVVRLLEFPAARTWAQRALEHEFDKADLEPEIVAELVLWNMIPRWIRAFVQRRFEASELPPSFWIGLLRDERLARAAPDTPTFVLGQIGRFPLRDVPADWLIEAMTDERYRATVIGWLEEADVLPSGLTAERLRGLVFDPDTRGVALFVLGRTALFRSEEVGIDWLLALARRTDPTLHEWAHAYLLAHVAPSQLGPGEVGARLFALASGAKEPEPARRFAQQYLLAHHPTADRSHATSLGIEPALPREAFTFDRVWPMLWDDRVDVRRLGVALTRVEFRRWGQLQRVYELAESPHKEVRNVAYAALGRIGAGEEGAGERKAELDDLRLAPEELDPASVFAMTESRIGSTRDAAMSLIQEHYARLGGSEQLGWLMQSADREVRAFAVRLLWERHRTDPGGLRTGPVLENLLRRTLFSIPPARRGQKSAFRQRLPANVAKRRLVEVLRDFALADRAFAERIAPILAEMTGSIARGEWQVCVSALLALRAAHGLTVPEIAPVDPSA